MSKLRRYYIPCSSIFITSVTKERRGIFLDPKNVQLLWSVIQDAQNEYSFELPAHIILPDHFHLLINLDEKETNFSKILQLIKGRFTVSFKQHYRIETSISLCQKRFWDHVIRNENDYKNHIDYIHWNPVKHGLTKDPATWLYSSFSTWYEEGIYSDGWGRDDMPNNIRKMDFQ